jgi:hypothetical protein
MRIYVLIFFVAALFLNSCENKSDQIEPNAFFIDKSEDFLVFGHVYGSCTGDCRDLYLLVDNELYADSNDDVPWRNTSFNLTPLTYQDYVLSEPLEMVPDLIVDGRFQEDDLLQYIADFDIYIYGKRNGNEFEMIFDAIDLNAHASIKAYALSVQQVTDELKKR